MEAVRATVVKQAHQSLPKSMSHPEEWVTLVRQELSDSLGVNIVRPMLSYLDTALQSQSFLRKTQRIAT